MYILVIDNNNFFVSVLKKMLHHAGFNRIESIESGLEGLLQISDVDVPDVIIMDQNQISSNGIDVLRSILLSKPDIRIVVLTGSKSMTNTKLYCKEESVHFIKKDNVTAENLPLVLYYIFTEKISYTRKMVLAKSLSEIRQTFVEILN